MNTVFWILWAIVAITMLVILYFFMIGLADGSVSSLNGWLWAGIVLGFPVLVGASYWLKTHGWIKAAVLLLSIPALPIVCYVLFFVILLISGHTRWN